MSASVLTTENWPLTESPQDSKPERRDYQRAGPARPPLYTAANGYQLLHNQQDAQPEAKHYFLLFKGTVRPDWICMRVLPLDRP